MPFSLVLRTSKYYDIMSYDIKYSHIPYLEPVSCGRKSEVSKKSAEAPAQALERSKPVRIQRTCPKCSSFG